MQRGKIRSSSCRPGCLRQIGCIQAILQLRQAFLNRLEGIQKARQEIVQGLTGSGPSAIRNRASAVAQLGVSCVPIIPSYH